MKILHLRLLTMGRKKWIITIDRLHRSILPLWGEMLKSIAGPNLPISFAFSTDFENTKSIQDGKWPKWWAHVFCSSRGQSLDEMEIQVCFRRWCSSKKWKITKFAFEEMEMQSLDGKWPTVRRNLKITKFFLGTVHQRGREMYILVIRKLKMRRKK